MKKYKPNATAASLLGFLHEGSMSGWDLSARSHQVIGDFWSLTTSQVYRELHNLEKAGLIEMEERGSRDRQPYSLTPRGRTAFVEWLMKEPGEEITRFPLLLTVAFGKHLPREKLLKFTDNHRRIHQSRLDKYLETVAQLEAAPDYSTPYIQATLDFGIRYERMVLQWFDGLESLLYKKEE
jgi:DNA-binding PadR family transcriptional regulator